MAERTILVADDDRDLVRLLTIQLEAVGYKVVTAGDGAETIEKARREHPDLIVLDIRMPAADAFAVMDVLKHSMDTRDIPVIILTAIVTDQNRTRAKELGASAFISKPYEVEELVDSIQDAIPGERAKGPS